MGEKRKSRAGLVAHIVAALLTVLYTTWGYRLVQRLYNLLGSQEVKVHSLLGIINKMNIRLIEEVGTSQRLANMLTQVHNALPADYLPNFPIQDRVLQMVVTRADNEALAEAATKELEHANGRIRRLENTRETLVDEATEIEHALPQGYFTGKSAAGRVEQLAHDWRRAIDTNKHLQAQLDSTARALPATFHSELEMAERVKQMTREHGAALVANGVLANELDSLRKTFYEAAGHGKPPDDNIGKLISAVAVAPTEGMNLPEGFANSGIVTERASVDAETPTVGTEGWTDEEIARYPEHYRALKAEEDFQNGLYPPHEGMARKMARDIHMVNVYPDHDSGDEHK